jgi:predicted ATP-grasp superfamily ATP-dependent carboligase
VTGKGSVLISEGAAGESRAALAAVRALSVGGYRSAVTVSGALSLAAASRHCKRRIRVPVAALEPEAYARAIARELAERPYVTVLPASDAALLALNAPVERFLDKVMCADLARAAGLEVPPTQVFANRADLVASGATLPYPVVVKPAIKHFAARRIDRPEDLQSLPAVEVALMVQPFLGNRLRGLLALVWEGELVSAVHLRYERIWPFPCGTVAAAETVAPDRALEERIEHMVAGYSGLIHADFAGPYLLDLNPRVHATLPVAVAAGVNLVALYCDMLRGAPITHTRGRPGVFFRHVEGDVRSVAHQVRRGVMSLSDGAAALRPRRGTVHSTESIHDPMPMVAQYGFLLRRVAARLQRSISAGT